MILLKLISWPYVKQHLARWMLTIAGIVLGVAVFVGIHTANQSVAYAFHQTVDRIAGSTQLQISAGETGFDENVLDRVQAVKEVRVAVPVIEAVVGTGVEGQGNLLILGVDMTGDRSLRDYDLESKGGASDEDIDDPLVFLAQPDSLMVTDTYARENHLAVGAKVPMNTMDGRKLFTIRGVMKSGGLTSAFGGNLAVMDVYAAQKVFGRGRKFDRIDLAVKDGASIADVQAKLEALLGPGFQVQEPSARAGQFDSISHVYTLTANVTSVFALFIGMFIIYNTFQIAVTQRRTEIGILRALGATRGQIRTLFLGESVVAGLFGSVLGLLVGIAIARGMTGYIGSLLGEIYGLAEKADEIATNPLLMTLAIVLGVITSVVAAILPARSAARVDPVQALQKGKYQQLSAGENRARRIAALVIAILAAGCLLFERRSIFYYAGDALTVLAALLLTPAFALWLARALKPLLRWMRPVEGTLAADSLLQAPRRTSGAVAALMLSLALVIALGGLARASYGSIYAWLRIALNPDLFVSPSQSLTQRDFRFPESMGAQLSAIPGIGQVQMVRDARIDIQGKPTMFVAADIAQFKNHATLPPVAGNTDDMFRRAEQGTAVLASENFALLRGYKLGDVIDIPSPSGVLHLPIAGIVTDYSDEQGSLLIDRSLYKRMWNDNTVNIFRIYLAPGASEADVKRRILEQFGNQRRLFVLTNREVRRYILRLTDQWFGITYVQIAVAVLVAILGIVNTLTVSITDRRRELGVLQAVGGLRNQIRGTIWLEALAVGMVGLILGLALGALQLYYSLHISAEDMAGLRLSYQYPYPIALWLLPGILLVAFLSAIAPAETAVRGSLVEASSMNKLAAICLLVSSVALAQDARQIVAESENRSRSKSQQYEGTLEVIGASNKISLKRWEYRRIGSYGTSKAILRFTAPAEVKGVALLIVNHTDRASDQWMWTPAIERDRRIAVQDRSTRFFGTDFSFEDLEERDVDQFDYKLAGEDTIDGAACWKIESKPKESKSSQYSSSLVWVRKDNYVVAKIDDYAKSKVIRSIHYSDIQNVDGIWTPRNVEVYDENRKSHTILKLEKLQYNLPMKDEDFTIEALRRG